LTEFKMDPFTRKVAKGMQDFGFKFKTRQPKGNHRRLEYKGPKAKRTLKYSLQSKAKEGSRGGIIQGLRKELISGGVNEQDTLWLDKIALGLIAIKKGDEKDDLEKKLFDAINSIHALEAAKLAFELGRASAQEDKNYESSAIAARQIEFDDRLRRNDIINKIRRYCHRRFIGIMEQKLEEVREIRFDLSHVYLPNPPSFSKQLTDIFELVPSAFAFNDDEEQITVFGEFKGTISKLLKKHGLTDRFNAHSDTIYNSGIYTLKTPQIFDHFDIPALYNIPTEAAELLLETIERTQANVELNIKGKYQV